MYAGEHLAVLEFDVGIKEVFRVFFYCVSYVGMVVVEGFEKFIRDSLLATIVCVVHLSTVQRWVSWDHYFSL